MEKEHAEWSETPVALSRFSRLSDAREVGLVLAAASIGYGIVREGRDWILQVEPSQEEAARREWGLYQSANAGASDPGPGGGRAPHAHASTQSMWLVACVMIGLAAVQAEREPAWREAGVLSAVRVWEGGEWWRVITALTLHADVPHVFANLATGLWFARWLIPALGPGFSWFSVLLTGVLGNALNVAFYYPSDHRSLGASTAVFGALGILVGEAVGSLFLTRPGRSWWRWVLPLGAGLALLAYLGAGGSQRERVDVAAHLWGFGVGVPWGFFVGRLQLGARLEGRGQFAAGAFAALVLAGAWVWALLAG